MRKSTLVILALASVCGRGVQAQSAQPQRDQVSSYIEAQMRWRRIPATAIGVFRAGRVIRAEGYGDATPQTVFHLGSVGKQFTSAAILMLAEEGKLSLNDTITRYLPATSKSWQGITIRHLLTHTSGLANYVSLIPDITKEFSRDELLQLIASQELLFKPGTGFRYSNSGYVLAGLIVEAVSMQPLGAFLADRVFAKLSMDSTGMVGDFTSARLRPGFRMRNDSVSLASYGSTSLNRTGDGSLASSITDFAKWDRALYGEEVLSDASRRAMWSAVRLADNSTRKYGLGWAVDRSADRLIVEHGGSWPGFGAHVVRHVMDSITVVVLTNLSGVGDVAGQIARKVARYYVPSLRAAEWPVIRRASIDSVALQKLTGTYGPSATRLVINRRGNELILSTRGRGKAALIPVSNTEFVHPTDAMTLRFVTTRAGKVQLVAQERGRAPIRLERVEQTARQKGTPNL